MDTKGKEHKFNDWDSGVKPKTVPSDLSKKRDAPESKDLFSLAEHDTDCCGQCDMMKSE